MKYFIKKFSWAVFLGVLLAEVGFQLSSLQFWFWFSLIIVSVIWSQNAEKKINPTDGKVS